MKLSFRILPVAAMAISFAAQAQPRVIDQVVAIVGSQIILQSDVEKQYVQYMPQGSLPEETVKCGVFDQMKRQKLLLNEASIDGVTVYDDQVSEELDKRMPKALTQ